MRCLGLDYKVLTLYIQVLTRIVVRYLRGRGKHGVVHHLLLRAERGLLQHLVDAREHVGATHHVKLLWLHKTVRYGLVVVQVVDHLVHSHHVALLRKVVNVLREIGSAWLELVRSSAHRKSCGLTLISWDDDQLVISEHIVIFGLDVVVEYLSELLGVGLEITEETNQFTQMKDVGVLAYGGLNDLVFELDGQYYQFLTFPSVQLLDRGALAIVHVQWLSLI